MEYVLPFKNFIKNSLPIITALILIFFCINTKQVNSSDGLEVAFSSFIFFPVLIGGTLYIDYEGQSCSLYSYPSIRGFTFQSI